MHGRIISGFSPVDDPQLLGTATIYVPNRRTARALSIAFLAAGGSKAQLLPKIRTLGDVGEDEFGLVPVAAELSLLPKTVGELERKLALARMIQHWVDALSAETRRLYDDEDVFIPSSQADAIRLSEDLCRLLDQISQEEIDWNSIQNIIPQEHSQWWSITSTFLKIIMENWPQALQEEGLVDPGESSRRLVEKRIDHFLNFGSKGPVIVAGSTGSVPSTRRFLKTISNLSNGAIVLPGLDMHMPEKQWQMLATGSLNSADSLESHPQFGLAGLLHTIGLERRDVTEISKPEEPIVNRNRLISIALSLPNYSTVWKAEIGQLDPEDLQQGFENVALIEAPNERKEATAIAIALREILEQPERTAALVTPDRNLARRVALELRRFGVNVDDTAGLPLRNSQAGLFIRQLIRFCFDVHSKSELAALIKSPLMLAGSSQEKSLEIARTIELIGLRGTVGRPRCGELVEFFQIRKAQMSKPDSGKEEDSDKTDERWDAVLRRASELDEILLPFRQFLMSTERASLSSYVSMLIEVVEKLTISESGISAIEAATGTGEIQALFDEIRSSQAGEFEIAPSDFPSVFDALIAPITIRQREATHPRLHIYGPLEIRLQHHDRVIMAGLNEGKWPQATRNDAFLNRTMRLQLGMASPERRTGLAAHDFQQIAGKEEVIFTRSTRVDKSPTIASRWLQRLFALLGNDLTTSIRTRGEKYLSYEFMLDGADERTKRGARPNPKPPVHVRPKNLPVTDIETWIRDPYALYAKRILKLRPLDPLEREIDQLFRGTLYHAILEEYVSLDALDLKPEIRLLSLNEIAHRKISEQVLPTDLEVVWQLQFGEIAARLIDWETRYSTSHPVKKILKEVKGSIFLANGEFRLHARADRIDVLEDGSLVVLDYKTGMSPSPKQARTLSPQIALEGAIALSGGFENVEAGELDELAFIRLVQGKKFGIQRISDKGNPITEIVDRAQVNLEDLIVRFQDKGIGYISRRAPFRDGDINGVYDHLARTREWSFGEEGDSGE